MYEPHFNFATLSDKVRLATLMCVTLSLFYDNMASGLLFYLQLYLDITNQNDKNKPMFTSLTYNIQKYIFKFFQLNKFDSV